MTEGTTYNGTEALDEAKLSGLRRLADRHGVREEIEHAIFTDLGGGNRDPYRDPRREDAHFYRARVLRRMRPDVESDLIQ